jgi:hypothetical protein
MRARPLEPGLMRAQRLARGWSLKQAVRELHGLAARKGVRVGLTVHMLSTYENGRRQPGPLYRWLFGELYGLPPAALGLADAAAPVVPVFLAGYGADVDAQPGDPDVNRRSLFQHAAMAGAAVLTPAIEALGSEPWERLSLALKRPASTDAKTVRDLGEIAAACEELYARVAPDTLVGTVVGHLQTVSHLLQREQPDAIHRRLCSIAGGDRRPGRLAVGRHGQPRRRRGVLHDGDGRGPGGR